MTATFDREHIVLKEIGEEDQENLVNLFMAKQPNFPGVQDTTRRRTPRLKLEYTRRAKEIIEEELRQRQKTQKTWFARAIFRIDGTESLFLGYLMATLADNEVRKQSMDSNEGPASQTSRIQTESNKSSKIRIRFSSIVHPSGPRSLKEYEDYYITSRFLPVLRDQAMSRWRDMKRGKFLLSVAVSVPHGDPIFQELVARSSRVRYVKALESAQQMFPGEWYDPLGGFYVWEFQG